MPARLALKVDVDTDRGTRLGIPNLLIDLHEFSAPACFLFSLGPDNTGKAIKRVFRPGFLKKVSRTNVVQLYGVRTLLNGTLLPAPHIGQRHERLLRKVRDAGHEVGIHCHDHIRWQDHLFEMDLAAVRAEFGAATAEFERIFGTRAHTAGAAGWQSNAFSREVYDEAGLLYSSDTRGTSPFFPRIAGRVFQTLEIPSTLPTFDELLGRPEFPDTRIVSHYLSSLSYARPNILTIHAEIEGLGKRGLFHELLSALARSDVQFVRLDALARELLENRTALPVCDQVMAEIDGRSGLVATQVTGGAPGA
jgi:peptidoglycan/xylan/chitin deacetylase (PgdA/CDA1 family)